MDPLLLVDFSAQNSGICKFIGGKGTTVSHNDGDRLILQVEKMRTRNFHCGQEQIPTSNYLHFQIATPEHELGLPPASFASVPTEI